MTAMRVGLTGGIGSGKSTVCRILERLGATIVDADAISRALTQAGGAAIEPIRAEFGDLAISADGAMDRARMREAVFDDATVKHRLEAILHPLIMQETRRQAEAARTESVVFDVPLLAEAATRWLPLLDFVFVVDCEVETQITRVMARSGWPRDTVLKVIAQQATREQRLAIADVVITNDGVTLPMLEAEVRRRYEERLAMWQAAARATSPLPRD